MLLGPIADELLPFRFAFGVDLPAVTERAVIALASEPKGGALVTLQGRSLVTPKLTDAMRGLAAGNVRPAWEGGPDVYGLGPNPTYVAVTETGLLLSARRELVVEVLEKVEPGKRSTAFADPTIAAGFQALHRPAVQNLPMSRSAAIQLVVGLRRNWQKAHPAAEKLNFLAGLVVFDPSGMHVHALAEEAEAGKAHEFVRAFGNSLVELSRTLSPPEPRLERLGSLLADLKPAHSGSAAKKPYVHLATTVPPRRLEEWLSEFLPNKDN